MIESSVYKSLPKNFIESFIWSSEPVFFTLPDKYNKFYSISGGHAINEIGLIFKSNLFDMYLYVSL
jgi:hypothetical protein